MKLTGVAGLTRGGRPLMTLMPHDQIKCSRLIVLPSSLRSTASWPVRPTSCKFLA